MFSPMSSGRDNWEEAGGDQASSIVGGSAGPSNQSLPIRANVSTSKGKGKTKDIPIPQGRVIVPPAADKKSFAFGFSSKGEKKSAAERRTKRNHYAMPASVDEEISTERRPLLGSPSSSSASIPHRSSSRRKQKANIPRWKDAFRPHKKTVDLWMESWTARWTVLAIIPSIFVWIWCALPFPGSQRDKVHSHTDGQFLFFLIWYYGIYNAVGLIYITQLFSLYRLNWWPAALGARKSYVSFWLLSIISGYMLHSFGWDRLPSMGKGWLSSAFSISSAKDDDDDEDGQIQWQRKTPWVALALATMAMPALVCLAGLRRGGRQTYRHSLTDTQKSE